MPQATQADSCPVSPVPTVVEQAHSFNGLGISIYGSSATHSRRVSAETFPDQPESTAQTPAQPLLSPPATSHLSQTTYVASPYDGSGYGDHGSLKPSLYSAPSFELQSFKGSSQTHLRADEVHTGTTNESSTTLKRQITTLRQRGWTSWITISTILLALYSTVFSGIYLAIAFRAPAYGHYISASGNLTASTAAFLTSLFAKTIEMTFVTAMLAVLGQELSRRAYGKSKWIGVSIAEMGMRNWIVQPGTLISRWESVRYAGITLLGIFSLVATLVAALYTPASTALVQPQLRLLDWQPRTMQAAVKTSFANVDYIGKSCHTPISPKYDPVYSGSTCVAIGNAASGYYNFFEYLSQWNTTQNATAPQYRPNGTALIFGNTIVTAPWIETIDMDAVHKKTGYVVNNVSLALPHAGIVGAARNPVNNIIQPGDLDGLGAYEVRAGVPSPVIHVLCATLSKDDLKPFVYELWDDAEKPVNVTKWPEQMGHVDKYLNGTKLDTLFHWDAYYGEMAAPPIFPKLPLGYNTVMNFTGTGGMLWGRDSIYMLSKAGAGDVNNETDFGGKDDYALCQMRISQTSKCSTRFNAAASGNTLTAHCEDADDTMAYELYRDKNSRNTSYATPSSSGALDWPNLAFLWGTSLSLNDGIFDGKASIARLLTQQILRKPKLLDNLPSMAESLAVLAANTLLTSSIDAPIVDFWNLTDVPPNILNDSVYQYFPAQVRVQEYASGGSMGYHRAFFPVLFIMFTLNLAALVYLALHREWLVDLSEPQTLLSLAVSSPGTAANHASDDADNLKEWRSNPTGAELDVGWAVRECDSGVVIQRTPQTDTGTPLQGLRQRLSSHWEGRHGGSSRPPDRSTFQPLSDD